MPALRFLKDLAADAQSLGRVRHVDSQMLLESMVLLLTHFTGNMVCNHRGESVNVAHNVMLLSSRRSCPLWLKPIIAHLHSRRTETGSFLDNLMSTGFMQKQPEDDDDDVVKQMLRRAHPTPFAMHDMFEHGYSLFSPAINGFMIARGDDPLSQGQAGDGAVLLVEGSQHIKELCAQDQSNSLYTRIQRRSTPRISVYGWCEGNPEILDTELPGMPLLLPAQYGNGMRMNTGIEGRSIVHRSETMEAAVAVLKHACAVAPDDEEACYQLASVSRRMDGDKETQGFATEADLKRTLLGVGPIGKNKFFL